MTSSKVIALFIFSLVAAFAAALSDVQAQPNYVEVRLPLGVRADLPRNWVALSNNQRITLSSSVQATVEQRGGYFDASSDLAFAANLYDDNQRAVGIFNIRYYPTETIKQEDIRAASASEIKDVDKELQRSLTAALPSAGLAVVEWLGSTKRTINGKSAIVTSYRRQRISPPLTGIFRVRLVRILDGGKTFTATLSYAEDNAILLEPISERIISSIRY